MVGKYTNLSDAYLSVLKVWKICQWSLQYLQNVFSTWIW